MITFFSFIGYVTLNTASMSKLFHATPTARLANAAAWFRAKRNDISTILVQYRFMTTIKRGTENTVPVHANTIFTFKQVGIHPSSSWGTFKMYFCMFLIHSSSAWVFDLSILSFSPVSRVTWLQGMNSCHLVRPKFKQLRSYGCWRFQDAYILCRRLIDFCTVYINLAYISCTFSAVSNSVL